MVKEIVVEPVTRLEGHGGLRIVIGDDGFRSKIMR